MAWIESHQSLGNHRKLFKLAGLLKVSKPQAVGHLHYLWWWALDNAPDGCLAGVPAAVIAEVAEWRGHPEKFVAALREAGFMDGSDLHDWDDFAGKLVERRRLSKEQRVSGGLKRMSQLTHEERSELAKKAAAQRWDASKMPATDASYSKHDMPATVPNSTNSTVPKSTVTTTTPLPPSPAESLSSTSEKQGEVTVEKTVFQLWDEEILPQKKWTALIANEITDLCDHFGEDWVKLAIKEAALHDKRNFKYVQGVLENWATEGGPAIGYSKPQNVNNKSDPERFTKGRYGANVIRRGVKGEPRTIEEIQAELSAEKRLIGK